MLYCWWVECFIDVGELEYLFVTKAQKQFSGEGKISSGNSAKTNKNNFYPHLAQHTKMNSKWITHTGVKPKTINF